MRRHAPFADSRDFFGRTALGQMVACPYEYLVRYMAFFPDAALGLSAGTARRRARGPSVFSESRHAGEYNRTTENYRIICLHLVKKIIESYNSMEYNKRKAWKSQ